MAVGDNLTVVGLSAVFPNTRIIVLSLKRDLVVMRCLDLGVGVRGLPKVSRRRWVLEIGPTGERLCLLESKNFGQDML